MNIPLTNGSSDIRVAPNSGRRCLFHASVERNMQLISHYNMRPAVIDIYGAVEGRDLGGVARDMTSIIEREKKGPALPGFASCDGSRADSNDEFVIYVGLLAGLGFSILLVYLLIVINFQSWLDPFIILTALPAAFAGIVWLLFVTGTTISVPALTGAIMCMGVATANSILVVSFSKERFEAGKTPFGGGPRSGNSRVSGRSS